MSLWHLSKPTVRTMTCTYVMASFVEGLVLIIRKCNPFPLESQERR